VCVLGATSAVAEHVARRLVERGDRVALVGRNAARLAAIAADLRSRGAGLVVVRAADLAARTDPGALLDATARELGGLDAVLIFHGLLGDHGRAEADPGAARLVLETNFASPAAFALAAAARLEDSAHPKPVLLAVGSVAGDRGRASNYVYGAAKAGLAVLFQGLAHRFALARRNVRVVLVKPGFIDTPMTAEFDKSGPLWSTPDAVAAVVVRAMERGGPIVYAPGFWRWIMLVFRLLPQPAMNRVRV
jgi:NAD(P)-dependent dehydrogenase (short-subunit alcohol dehydrogenase family)